jgi:hypothetical protein
VKRGRLIAAAAAVLASALLASPAAAFTAPELFVRMQRWDTHDETGPWVPLAGAPAIEYLGGYEIGYRLQASGETANFQRVALTVAGVPDGAPTQPYNAEPYCVGRAGAVGEIVAAAPEIQFEGDGTYTVRVSLGAGAGGPSGCLDEQSTTASFRVGIRVAPELVGEPMLFRAVPLEGDPFVGVRAPDPPGGQADVRCAVDATVDPDGSVSGPETIADPDEPRAAVAEFVFTRPGAWTCVARGAAEGLDDAFESVFFGTPWSAPLTFDVDSDFRRRPATIRHVRSKRPQVRVVAEWPDAAAGGTAKLTLLRVTGCRGKKYRLRRTATYRARFGAERARITVRRPRRPGHFLGRLRFSGTRFLHASVDPEPLPILTTERKFGFVSPLAFPVCR